MQYDYSSQHHTYCYYACKPRVTELETNHGQ